MSTRDLEVAISADPLASHFSLTTIQKVAVFITPNSKVRASTAELTMLQFSHDKHRVNNDSILTALLTSTVH